MASKRKVQTAAQRLEALEAELVEIRDHLEELGEDFQAAVAADDDAQADRLESQVVELEGRARRLGIKRDAAQVQADQEAQAKREADGIKFAQEADARHAEIVADLARAQALADELTEIARRHDNFAMAEWAGLARKAHARGAQVQRTLPDIRALREALQDAAKRMASGRDYGVQLASEPTRSSAPARPVTLSEIWAKSEAAGIA